VSTDGYPAWPDMLRWLNTLKDRVETIPAISLEQVVTGTLDPSMLPDIPWDQVLKAGSSLADLETTSAAALTSGTLLDGRMPALTGDVSSAVGTVATTLATVNVNPGSFGSGTAIPLVTVNGKGLVTSVVEQPIVFAGGGYTVGDLLVADSLTTLTTLPDVAAGSYLRSGGLLTAPVWSTLKLPNAAATGDLLYASSADTLVVRTIGASGDVLTVSGGVPVWAATSGLGTGDLTRVDDTNVTLTLGGAPTDALFKDVSITAGWTGTLAVGRGGTGTGTTFTAGSVVFAGASGVYSQDNAKFFWNDSNFRLGLNTNSPASTLEVVGGVFVGNNVGDTYISGNSLNGQYSSNANAIFHLNYTGYQAGTTQFRDTQISDGKTNSVLFVDGSALNVGFGGTIAPTARIHIAAGTATASTAPLKLTSGTNLTTAEAGAVEYDGTNLFFTRAGTVRENVLVAIDNVAAPTTNAGTPTTRYGGDTNYLGDPNRWLSVNVLGATYKIPLYT